MPHPKNVLAQPVPPEQRPRTCQWGHPIVWLLGGDEANGDGCLLGACACCLRREDNRSDKHNASVPNLWRYVPPRWNREGKLTPYFPSMNRVAFALAVRLYDLAGCPAPSEASLASAARLIRRATVHLQTAPRPSVGPIPGVSGK